MPKKRKKSKDKKLIDPETGAPIQKKIDGVPIIAKDGYLGDGMEDFMRLKLSDEDFTLFQQWVRKLEAKLRKESPGWRPPRASFGVSYRAKGDGRRISESKPQIPRGLLDLRDRTSSIPDE